MDSGKIFLSTVFFLLMLACAYGVYALVSMILSGVATGNWLMVIGGGILAYLFAGLLIAGTIGFFLLFILAITMH